MRPDNDEGYPMPGPSLAPLSTFPEPDPMQSVRPTEIATDVPRSRSQLRRRAIDTTQRGEDESRAFLTRQKEKEERGSAIDWEEFTYGDVDSASNLIFR